MSKITNKNQFRKKFPREYEWLRRNNPSLLNEFFPNCINHDPNDKKNMLIRLALTGKDKPSSTPLGHMLYIYTKMDHASYDEKFTKKLKGIRPDWFYGRAERSLYRMLKLMPKNLVEYDHGQRWRGPQQKHIFICKKYGRFMKTRDSVVRSWEKGLSGHPKMAGIARNKSRVQYVKNVDTGVVYKLLQSAAFSVKRSDSAMVMALKRGTKCGGYHWAYCDKNGKVIK